MEGKPTHYRNTYRSIAVLGQVAPIGNMGPCLVFRVGVQPSTEVCCEGLDRHGASGVTAPDAGLLSPPGSYRGLLRNWLIILYPVEAQPALAFNESLDLPRSSVRTGLPVDSVHRTFQEFVPPCQSTPGFGNLE